MMEDAGWIEIPADESQMKPGDVVDDLSPCSYNNYEPGTHVLIYAGDGKYWDQRGCVISSGGSPPCEVPRSYTLNSNCKVWRKP